jgi:hypothetical protein
VGFVIKIIATVITYYTSSERSSVLSLVHARPWVPTERRHGPSRVPGYAFLLRDVAHDGVLCTFRNRSAPDRGQVVWSIRAGGMDRPSRTRLHPSGSLSSSQPGGPPCWASPVAFDLIDCPYNSFPFHSCGEAGYDVRGRFKSQPRSLEAYVTMEV